MQWAENDIVVGRARLHYRRAGEGQPVLCLHGVTDNGACWGRTAEVLARSRDVVLLDQRAHGLSSAPDSGYTMVDFAEDAAGVLRSLGLAPAAVVGHSMGAMVTLVLAVRHPELLTCVVLEDPPLEASWMPRGESDPGMDERRFAWFQVTRDAQTMSREELVAQRRAESPAWSLDDCERWAESKLQVRSRLWEPAGVDLSADWRVALREIDVPVLLVAGDSALGSLIDDDLAAEVDSLARRGEVVRIAGAGHSIHRDRVEEFLDAVLPFLAASEQRRAEAL